MSIVPSPRRFASLGWIIAVGACSRPPLDNAEGSLTPVTGGSVAGTGGSVGAGTTMPATGIPGGAGEGNPDVVGNLGGGGEIDTNTGQAPAECASFQPIFARTLEDVASQPDLVTRVANMPVDRKVRQMYGWPSCSYNSGTECFQQQDMPEEDLPLWQMRDGPRGVRRLGAGPATAFPVAMARGASFDVALEERVGEAIGREMLAFKYDIMLAPTINTLRHPGWGRAQETYGEDTVVLGELGAAFVRGIQNHVPTCVKHFAANNSDDNRTTVSANMDEQTLREVYTRQFQIVVEKSDPACVMAAYNRVNGTFSAENRHLLTEILRDEWQWKGLVLSDWGATKSTTPSALAGLDLEMPDDVYFKSLLGEVQANRVPVARIDEAVQRVFNVKRRFNQLNAEFRTNAEYQNTPENPAIVDDPGIVSLAREAAEEGMVLLENKDSILPLQAGQRVLVAGPDGNVARLGDRGSSEVVPSPDHVVTPFAGLAARGLQSNVAVDFQGELAAAVAAAPSYDKVVLIVGMEHRDEGEGFNQGGDRDNLDLNGPHPILWPEGQKPRQWIEQLTAVNPNVIVVLSVGGAIVEPSLESAKGLIYSFYPGEAGGAALASLMFGDINFSGKLPFTVAADPSQYPAFGNNVDVQQYEYLHGYRKFEAEGLAPRYWFGSGQSYTTYEYSNLRLACSEGISPRGLLVVDVDVKNTGNVAGTEVVQLYIAYPNTAVRRSVKELKAFQRVPLGPGETKTVQLQVPARDFAYYDMTSNSFQVELVEHTVFVGPSADPARLSLSAPFSVIP
jgi:beta-glucosidase